MRCFRYLALLAALPMAAHNVSTLKVRILSTMLADEEGFGEWGFAALVEADGRRILFDTGAHPDTVLRNLAALKIDISDVTDVVLSHHHLDHTAGLVTLREAFLKRNPNALATTHVGTGIMIQRTAKDGSPANPMLTIRAAYEKTGGRFIEHGAPVEIYPGVWLTGPIPRKYPERNWNPGRRIPGTAGDLGEDNLPEDQSLVVETAKGLVVVAGCSHAGIVNILDFSRSKLRQSPIHAVIGGFHLFAATENTLAWTAGKFKEFGLQNLLGAHCTGIEAVYRLRELVGLDRKTAAVGALGGGFTLGVGLDPGDIAR